MPADIIVGLQLGSEGKGKVAAALADKYQAAVRVGAPNAGHSVIKDGVTYKMRQIPCAWVNPDCKLYVGAGGLINPDVLEEEFKMFSDPDQIKRRFFIDGNAGLVLDEDIEAETAIKMFEGIGSTTEGIGAAQARKVMRKNVRIAKQLPALERFISPERVALMINKHLEDKENVMFEGTQGFGLCLNHAYEYPFCTSRDILASSILSDAGVSPRTVRHVFGVLRTYPIRVFGNSGPMGATELTWEEVAKRSGYPELNERTTVTKRVRRVSEFNLEMVKEACVMNGVTAIFINFADYLDCNLRGKKSLAEVADHKALADFVAMVESSTNVGVAGISTGPETDEMIWTPFGMQILTDLSAKIPVSTLGGTR